MRPGTFWYEARRCDTGCNPFIINGEACEIKVIDKDVNRSLRRRGVIQLMGMVLMSMFIAAGISALPPYP